MRLILQRLSVLGADERGTPGALFVDGKLECFTLENPWKGNERNVSCVPAGTYKLRHTNSPRYGPDSLKLCDVPGRSHILIHQGNWERNTRGCILVGKQSAAAPGQEMAVYKSVNALNALKRRVADSINEAEIEIRDFEP